MISAKILFPVALIILSACVVIANKDYYSSLANNTVARLSNTKPQTSMPLATSKQIMKSIVTNQWYSSLYYEDWSSPLFVYPLTYKLSEKALEINYPVVRGTPATVFASHRNQLNLSLKSGLFTSKEVIDADTASVGIRLCSKNSCMRTRFARGVPSLTITPEHEDTYVLGGSIQSITEIADGFSIVTDHGTYVVGFVQPGSGSFEQTESELILHVGIHDRFFIGLQPDDAVLSPHDFRFDVTGTEFGYSARDQDFTAKLAFSTHENNTPLLASLPHMQSPDTVLGTYQSLRGTMKLARAESLTTSVADPVQIDVPTLVSGLTAAQKLELVTKVKEDVIRFTNEPYAEGVYFGGKTVFMRAQVLEIALALGINDDVAILKDSLTKELLRRLSLGDRNSDSYLVYSASPAGILSTKPEFGHELFNDHHFHFGYYLASAGILLDSDPQALDSVKEGLQALLLDIANLDTTNGYPYIRGFDTYESHSWADGRATTGDGNNQESTSEAILRFYGIYRVGKALGDETLENLGRFGMASEQLSASTYWLAQHTDHYTFPQGFTAPIAALVWGGKVDYATWFSANPSHIFGIQFLPGFPPISYVRNQDIWSKYKQAYSYDNSKPDSWNDIYNMIAVMHGERVESSLPTYEQGNTQSWYYLWVTYWSNQL